MAADVACVPVFKRRVFSAPVPMAFERTRASAVGNSDPVPELEYDTRDNAITASRGWRLHLNTGVSSTGLGSDFDGIEAPPRELNGVEDFPKITEGLLQRGYSEKDIRKILGENFIRVLKANEQR